MKPEWEAIKGRLTAPTELTAVETRTIRGNEYRVFANAPQTLRAIFTLGSMMYADKIAYIYNGEATTFSEQEATVTQFAHALSLLTNVAKGDRVALCLRNCPEWMFAFWATVCVGGIAVAINSTLHPNEMAFCLTDSDPRVVVVDAERATSLASFITKSKNITWIATADDEWVAGFNQKYLTSSNVAVVSFSSLCKAGSGRETLPEVDVNGGDDATILYTSGTTGKPKGVVTSNLNYGNVALGAAYGSAFFAGIAGTVRPAVDPNAPQVVSLHASPLFHTMGLILMIAVVLSGSKTIILPKWSALEAIKLIQKHQVNGFVGVPTMFQQIMALPDFSKYDLSSLQSTLTGAAPASKTVLREMSDKLKAPASNGYGLTETTSHGTYNYPPLIQQKPTSVGLPTAITDIAILKSAGEHSGIDFTKDPVVFANTGEIGEIAIRGPTVFKGYWRQPQATAKVLSKDGWFVTGDVGKLDHDGCLYILDRSKDMLIRGGENIYCAEVENILCDHPFVAEAAVVGLPDPVYGEAVCAIVVLKDVAAKSGVVNSIILHCKSQLALYKCPVQVEIWPDAELPKNAAGKVLKNDLKAKYVTPKLSKL